MSLRTFILFPFLTLMSISTIVSQPMYSGWPIDQELYGFSGCRVFRYEGEWEKNEILNQVDESTVAACLTVAMANVLNYYRWPKVSFFDGLYILNSGEKIVRKDIAHQWSYTLINGPLQKDENCENDDPHTRIHPLNPNWTGLDELHKLIYVVERTYGQKYNFVIEMTPDCGSKDGYFSLQYLLKNRLGYANCKLVDTQSSSGKQAIINNLKNNIPVIMLECGHSYMLDGYQIKNNRGYFHNTDFLGGSESMGWFQWKAFEDNGVVRAIIDLNPIVSIGKSPSTKNIAYFWGNKHIPFTSGSERQFFMRINESDSVDIDNTDFEIWAIPGTDTVLTHGTRIFSHTQQTASSLLRIPKTGTIRFSIDTTTTLILVIKNNDDTQKKFTITMHDFEKDHDITEMEKKLFPNMSTDKDYSQKKDIFQSKKTIELKQTSSFIHFIFNNPQDQASIAVYTLKGKKVYNSTKGIHTRVLQWNLKTNTDQRISSGFYIAQVSIFKPPYSSSIISIVPFVIQP